jgi:hypothetical protein
MADGYRGQLIMVFPGLDVVATTTGRKGRSPSTERNSTLASSSELGWRFPSTARPADKSLRARLQIGMRETGIHVRTLDSDPPSDQNNAIIGQPEKIADMYGVSLHRYIQNFQPFGRSSCILAGDDRAVADVVDNIVEVQ